MTKQQNFTEIPEFILQCRRDGIDDQVELITSFLAPLQSKEASDAIQEVKNIQAAFEFFEGTPYEEFMESLKVFKNLEAFNLDRYLNIVEASDLQMYQKAIFINLAITYENAWQLSRRTYNKKEELIKEIHTWTMTVLETIAAILKIVSIKLPSESLSKSLYSKICALNGKVITFAELGI